MSPGLWHSIWHPGQKKKPGVQAGATKNKNGGAGPTNTNHRRVPSIFRRAIVTPIADGQDSPGSTLTLEAHPAAPSSQDTAHDACRPQAPSEQQQSEATSNKPEMPTAQAPYANNNELWIDALGSLGERDRSYLRTLDGKIDSDFVDRKILATQIQKKIEAESRNQKLSSAEQRIVANSTSILNAFASNHGFDPALAILPWATVQSVILELDAKKDLQSRIIAGFALATWFLVQCDTYQHLYMAPDPALRPPKATLQVLKSTMVHSYAKLQRFLSLVIQCNNQEEIQRTHLRHRVKELQESKQQLLEAAESCGKHCDLSTETDFRGILNIAAESAVELETLKNAEEERRHKDLLDWLSEIDPSVLYRTARDKHEDGTGDWLRDSEQFKTWEESPGSLLWLHGKAGAGKSMLTSSVIKHLKDRCALEPDFGLAYFFLSFSNINNMSTNAMLESLIKQLYANQPDMPALAEELNTSKLNGEHLDIKKLEEVLALIIGEYSNVFIIVDGMDECPKLKGERKRLLDSLNRIIASMEDNLHIFLTSRKEPDIQIAMESSLLLPARSSLDLSDNWVTLRQDMDIYMDSMFESSTYNYWTPDLKMEAKRVLAEKADGMFQYLACQFDVLKDLSSISAIRAALEGLPDGLDETYNRALLNIKPDSQAQVLGVLKWLAFSKEPLRLSELAEIFILHPERSIPFDDAERLFNPGALLKHISSLVVTEKRDHQIYARFAHFSVQEYLLSDRIVNGPAAGFSFTERTAHLHIAHSCLAYHLYWSSGEARSACDKELAEYMTKNWIAHIEMVRWEEWPRNVTSMAAQALTAGSNSLSPIFTFFEGSLRTLTEDEGPTTEGWTRRPLSFTANQGLTQLTEMLLRTNKYLIQADLDEALSEAAWGRRKDIVLILLRKGADINARNANGRTPLYDAVDRGHRDMVEFLVDHGANINSQQGGLGSALQSAAWHGRLDLVQFFVGRGADVNLSSPTTGCPAISAAAASRTECLEFLLANGANAESQRAALHGAVGNVKQARGCLDVLLDAGGDVNARDENGGSALHNACKIHDSALMQHLVERGADVNGQGGDYGTALQALCQGGFDDRKTDDVRFLLDCGANVNMQGGYYGNALQAACFSGYPAVPRLLLDSGANVNAEGGYYGNALQAACCGGRDAIARLLLDSGADVNAEGGKFGNALQAACYGGHPMVATLLLDSGANVNAEGGYYGTALQAACELGSLDVVKLLLERGANVNAKAKSKDGSSALHVACRRGKMDLVRLLVEKGANIHARAGEHHDTALQAACAGGHTEVARLLIARHANVLTRGGEFGSAWHAAAATDPSPDHNILLRLLLDHGANINDTQGLQFPTALHAALHAWLPGKFNDALSRTQLLLGRGADINLAPGTHAAPLQYICTIENRSPCVKWLLHNCPSIDVEAPGGVFASALQAAAHSGQTDSVRLLLRRGADPNVRGGKYGSALHAAAVHGNWAIVEMLLDAGADPAKYELPAPEQEWLAGIQEEYGRASVDRYIKFRQVHGYY